ncbi:hypothetical protein SAMN04487772_12315 [[Clostridium] polysaccharolyticum]|jgi:hypothetical protein|uniref:Uncharacterized protein n=1 Tax=[Clostridium] polysaccharolyticum TaxID=29364 RepID=A0A1I0EMZ0_9FIRM|nr:hypothetical protein SAMN04487772_12315 [[Clostridium] polysaccharolyticum]
MHRNYCIVESNGYNESVQHKAYMNYKSCVQGSTGFGPYIPIYDRTFNRLNVMT